jgi:hypothetical protein
MAKDLPAVLRITSGATNENEFVLVHVETAGSKPLDLKLIGTDNESAFTVSCKIATDRPAANTALGPQIHALTRKLILTSFHLISKRQPDILAQGEELPV